MAKKNNEQKAEVVETTKEETKQVEEKAEVIEKDTVTEEAEQKAEVVETKEADVPVDAEEITNSEAFDDAIKELERVKAENEVLTKTLQGLETDKLELLKEKEELEEKLHKAQAGNNNDEYIALLKQFDAKIDEYAGLRKERLRKEFITDLKEEIQRQKEHFNA